MESGSKHHRHHFAWLYMGMMLVAGETLASPATPTFNCAKASGEVEKMICKDAGLIALDHKLAETYSKAMKHLPAADAAREKVTQRGWIKGRNDCWKAEDQRACVEGEYRTRIVQLQIRSGQLVAPPYVAYDCSPADAQPFTATFYKETDPPSAVLSLGNDQVIAFLQRTASGAKYTAANVEFWEHHGEAAINWFGKKLTCKAMPGGSNE